MGQYQRGGPGRQGPPPVSTRPAADVTRIFADAGYLAVNELGQRLGDELFAAGVKNSKVRNILNSFQAIAETWDATGKQERERQIARLQPNLIYFAARETDYKSKPALGRLAATLGQGVDRVLALDQPADEMKQRFTTLVDLVEAITAYHRAKSGG